MANFWTDVASSLEPISGQRKAYNKASGRITSEADKYVQMLLGQRGVDLSQFTQLGNQFKQGVLGGIDSSGLRQYQQQLGGFFGPQYQQALEQQILGGAAQGALAAGRLASGMGGQRRSAAFGGSTAEQVRRAQMESSGAVSQGLGQARAATEQARYGAVGQQADIGRTLLAAITQGEQGAMQAGLQGLTADQQFRLGILDAIGRLGSTATGALGGLGSAYLGASGSGWLQQMIQDWGGKAISGWLGGGKGGGGGSFVG